MYFIWQLKKFGLRCEILTQFYRAIIESTWYFSFPVWCGIITQDQKTCLNCVIRNAGWIIRHELPFLDGIFTKWSVARSRQIIANWNWSCPAYDLFQLLPSGRRYMVLRAHANCLCSSFFHHATGALNHDIAAWTCNCDLGLSLMQSVYVYKCVCVHVYIWVPVHVCIYQCNMETC